MEADIRVVQPEAKEHILSTEASWNKEQNILSEPLRESRT
jgi:hypothetical protein